MHAFLLKPFCREKASKVNFRMLRVLAVASSDFDTPDFIHLLKSFWLDVSMSLLRSKGIISLGLLAVFLFSMLVPFAQQSASAQSTFTISYESRPYVYVYPFENEMDRNVTVTNTGGDYTQLEFNATIYGPNGFVEDGNSLGIPPLPQPAYLYLQPGESNQIYVCVGWGDIDTSYWQVGANYTYTVELSVYPVGDPSLMQNANLTNIVEVLCTNTASASLTGLGVPPNASVSGQVLDADTGQPIAGAQVSVTSQGLAESAVTNSSGNYYCPLIAYRRVEQGNYIVYNVQVSTPGYQTFEKAIIPTDGQNITLNADMTKNDQTASYSVIAQFDTQMNNYMGAGSANGSIFALVPFHTTNVIPDYIYNNSYIYTFDSNGSLLWRYQLYCQTPTVDVSSDGSMIATTVQSQHVAPGTIPTVPIQPGIYLFNDSGNVIWNYTSDAYLDIGNVMTVKFSHDGQYLAAGDDLGNVVLIDLATKTVVWNAFLDGQVRDILFDQTDSTVYFSSGDGYVYAYSIAGAQLWRDYAGAWGLSMTSSNNYLLVSGKNGYYMYLINKSTGKTVQTVPVDHAGFGLIISPDQSFMIYYGGAEDSLTTVAGINGAIEYQLDPSNGGAISDDGKYFTETGTFAVGQNAQTYVSLFTNGGNYLWTEDISNTTQGAGEGYQWISADKTEIIATVGQYVYFLQGSITASSSSSPSPTPTPTPTPTPASSPTPSPNPSQTQTPTPTQTPSLTATPTASPNSTPAQSPTPIATSSASTTKPPSLAAMSQYVSVIAAVIILGAVIAELFAKRRKSKQNSPTVPALSNQKGII